MSVRVVVVLAAAIVVGGCGESSPSSPTPPVPESRPCAGTLSSTTNHRCVRPELELQAGWVHRRAFTDDQPRGINHCPDIRVQRASRGTRGSVQRLHGIGERCPSALRTVLRLGRESRPLHGYRSGNTIELESLANEAQVVKINVTLSASGGAAQGTYTITGGCAAGASGSIAGRQVNLTGVWTGLMGSIPARLNVLMADAPDTDGNFGVSGTATFSGTSCFPNAMITRRGRGRIVFPDIEGAPHRMELIAEVWDDLTAMKVAYALTDGTCPELADGDTTFVRQ